MNDETTFMRVVEFLKKERERERNKRKNYKIELKQK